MNRILLVLQPERISIPAIDFACYLTKLQKTTINIVFLGRDTVKGNTVPVAAEVLEKVYDTCIKRETAYNIVRYEPVATDELLLHTVFSDLLILDPELSLHNRQEPVPSNLARFILQHASCPVILSPEHFEDIREIIFTCDGNSDAAFAIKQFTYLCPGLNNVPVYLVEVLEREQHSCYHSSRSEWIDQHYSHINYITLRGEAREQLMLFLLSRHNCIAVLGSFGGGMIRHTVHSSTAQTSARYTTHPFFIAHR